VSPYVCLFVLLVDKLHPGSWERSHTAVQELSRLIPNFRKKIDEGSPEELSEFYAEVIVSFFTSVAY
jgi:hypothetical protein